MSSIFAHYDSLAGLFEFPGPDFDARGRAALESLRGAHPDAATEVQGFLDGMPQRVLDRQELYTRIFDVQALTTLDTGYVLFGDDYKRGQLLANLNKEHLEADNDCRGELADHLPNLLRLIPKLEDDDLREELVRNIVVPALILMVREFDPERIKKKNDNYQKHDKTLIDPARAGDPMIYRLAFTTLLNVLTKDFQTSNLVGTLTGWSSRPGTKDFLGLVSKEMEVERMANPNNSGCDA
jgi:nitrate reductase assembly molybdenum cofactor insertion protein NarJ